MPDDVFVTSPSRKSPSNRRSAAPLRPSTLADAHADDNAGGAGNGRFSLAHELAVAMMPEPSAGSKLLAEEFGIEFDEGAEGIDGPPSGHGHVVVQQEEEQLSFAGGDASVDFGDSVDPTFASPTRPDKETRKQPTQDALEVLAQDLASTDNFLGHLRRLDADSSALSPSSPSFASTSTSLDPAPPSSSSSSSSQPALERLASDVIRRINDTARDREGQVRALLEYEREFRRIAGEVGGQDVLGGLDALPVPEPEEPVSVSLSSVSTTALAAIPETEQVAAAPRIHRHQRTFSQDWETDPDVDRLGDAAETEPETDPAYDAPPSPTLQRTFSPMHSPSVSFSIPASLSTSSSAAIPPSPSSTTAPQSSSTAPAAPALATNPPTLASLSTLRTHTSSLIHSLALLSEQAQVNGAGAADAGRRLRALRNRLGGWRAEWEGAERSRGRIERWERGEAVSMSDGETGTGDAGTGGSRRIDGRKFVAEHLHAFEAALAEAAVKTNAIMAAS